MTTPNATNGGCYACHCILELRRNSDCFSTSAEENRRYRSTKCAIFSPKLHFQRAPAPIEEDGTFEARSVREGASR
jgi:hypothetical protein